MNQQIQALTWIVYSLIFVLVLVRTLRRPTPAHVDMTLFFGAVFMIIVASVVWTSLQLPREWFSLVIAAALMGLPYLLLRLVGDFSAVPSLLMRVAEAGLIASVFALVVVQTPPIPVVLALVGYFVLLTTYDTYAFVRAARQTTGVTRRRMQAVAAGSGFLGLVLLLAGVSAVVPDGSGFISQLSGLAGLASAISYFIGFAPPTWLRRAWQEPELRAFLGRAASLPRLPDTASIVRELEHGAGHSLGAAGARIGLWDEPSGRLRFAFDPSEATRAAYAEIPSLALNDGVIELDPHEHPVSGRAFLNQAAYLVTDLERADPGNAALYRANNARSALAAPITAGRKRLGVLVVYAPRAPMFANSDLELVRLLADQAAVLLESRALIDEATHVRAREEATRLKDDFLSSAAHDLKTPLTGLVAQAQLLLRRADRDPAAPVDRVGLRRLLEQSLRLRDLVLELLDVSRLQHGGLLGERRDADLSAIAAEVVAACTDRTRVRLDAPEPVVARVDHVRMGQVIANLIENGLKYSPVETSVDVHVWQVGDEARITVQDAGIGIPAEDLLLVFERFHRAGNVDDRRFAGMGLGLYIARGIVDEHGGRVWVESVAGRGSTFHVAVPVAAGDIETRVPPDTLAARSAAGA